MGLADRSLKVRKFLEVIGISHGSGVSISNDYWGIRKPLMNWVQPLLTNNHKRNRMTTSNMITPQLTRDQAVFETLGFSGQMSAKI